MLQLHCNWWYNIIISLKSIINNNAYFSCESCCWGKHFERNDKHHHQSGNVLKHSTKWTVLWCYTVQYIQYFTPQQSTDRTVSISSEESAIHFQVCWINSALQRVQWSSKSVGSFDTSKQTVPFNTFYSLFQIIYLLLWISYGVGYY